MKKDLLFFLTLLCMMTLFSVEASSAVIKTINLTLTVGKPYTIRPLVDSGKSLQSNSTNNVSRYTLAPEIISTDVAIVVNGGFQSMNGGVVSRYEFTITPLKTGSFSFSNMISWSEGGNYKDGDMVYNITVVDVTAITIPSEISLQKGESYTFAPAVSHPSADTSLSWSSTNTSVASVSNTGVVTTGQVGSAIITCIADNGVSASCAVTVMPVKATDVVLNYTEAELELGKRLQLEASVIPDNTDNKSVTWTSSNENVAVVSSSGNVTALGLGYANIVATTKDGSNIKSGCLVHVVEPAVLAKSISLDWTTANLKVGQAAQLVATLTPANVSTFEVEWRSSDPTCVSVNNEGIINALKPGTATVTATTTDGTQLSASCIVTVKDKGVDDIDNTVYTSNATGCIGGTVTLPVKMKNNTPITGFQFNVVVPDGFEITKVTRGERIKTQLNGEYAFTFNSSAQPDGSRFVLCYTSNNVDIAGSDGEVALVTIQIPSGIARGDYPIVLRDIELSKAGSSLITESVTSVLTISDFTPGDANGDGRISVADLTAIASHLLGNSPDGFVETAADATGDGRISVADLTAIADQLMNGNNK